MKCKICNLKGQIVLCQEHYDLTHKQIKKEATKVFKGDTLRNLLKQLLTEGYTLANIKQTWDYIKENNINSEWFVVANTLDDGVFRQITQNELENIEKFYENNLRLWCVYGFGSRSYAGGLTFLDDSSGRFVGVTPEASKKVNKK